MARGHAVFEIDQPDGASSSRPRRWPTSAPRPTADRRAVAVDLRDDWPPALTAAGFDATAPTAWSAEGLLVYLPPEAQDRLFDDITALSAPGSRLATEYHPDGGAALGERAGAVADQWRDHGFDVDLADLFYAGDRTPVVDYLTAQGLAGVGPHPTRRVRRLRPAVPRLRSTCDRCAIPCPSSPPYEGDDS